MKKAISLLLVFSIVSLPLTLQAQTDEDNDPEPEVTDPCVAAQADARSDTQEILWIADGCLFGCVGVGAAYLGVSYGTKSSSHVPCGKISRIRGPLYLLLPRYTDCYRKEGRWLQTNRAMAGCIVSGLHRKRSAS